MVRNAIFREMGLSIVLAIQVANMFVIAPLAATGQLSLTAVDVARFGLAAAAVILLTHNRLVALVIGATFLVSVLLSLVLRTGGGSLAIAIVNMAITTAFDAAVGVAVANVAFGDGRVTVHRIMGAIILYLSIGLIFANAYRASDLLLASAFRGLPEGRGALSQMLYFSLTTLTTTGYGDIAPLHPFVRSLANLEAVIGQIFPATLLARLVTLHAAAPHRDSQG
jgi:hypothetical protein